MPLTGNMVASFSLCPARNKNDNENEEEEPNLDQGESNAKENSNIDQTTTSERLVEENEDFTREILDSIDESNIHDHEKGSAKTQIKKTKIREADQENNTHICTRSKNGMYKSKQPYIRLVQ